VKVRAFVLLSNSVIVAICLLIVHHSVTGVWYEDDPNQSKPDEKFFNSKRSGELGAGAWRMMTVQLDFTSNSLRLYLDGRLVGDSLKGLKINPSFSSPIPSWAKVHHFSRSFIQFDDYHELMPGADQYTREKVDAITFRAADIRLYQHVLTEAELQKIHLESTWPRGGTIRQVESFFILKEELSLFGFVIVFY